MKPNNKRLFRGWIAGIALGLGSGAALVYAVTIPHTFTPGTNASASEVNQNFAALKSALDALEAGPSCAGENVVRVGSLCFDRFRARADFTGCLADGSDCTVAATSTDEGAPAVDMSWAQAARACTNAGKRLPLPGEWLVAFTSGQLEETSVEQLEFVNAFLTLHSLRPDLDPSSPGSAAPAQAGYMGPRSAAGNRVQLVTNAAFDERDADGGTDFIFFRCVR